MKLNNDDGTSQIVPLSSPLIPLRPGNDELYAGYGVAQVRSALHSHQVYGFSTVEAYSQNGGVDTERLETFSFKLQKYGAWITPPG